MVLTEEEQARLDALRNLDILNTPQERIYDEIVRLATQLMHVPSAVVTLVAEDYQWFKAGVGFPAGGSTPISLSFCAHAIAQHDLNEVFVVNDATKDERFRDWPNVTGEPHIRFYAGAPLVSRDGYGLGTLCIVDTKPREITAEDKATLSTLAKTVMAQIELRRAAEMLRVSEEKHRLVLDTSMDAIVMVDGKGIVQYWNASAEAMFGIAEHRALKQPLYRLAPSIETPWLVDPDVSPVNFDEKTLLQARLKRADGSGFPAEICVTPVKLRDGVLFALCIRDAFSNHRWSNLAG